MNNIYNKSLSLKKALSEKILSLIHPATQKLLPRFQATPPLHLLLASGAFGICAVFFYFFATYFSSLYLVALLFLICKFVSFELCQNVIAVTNKSNLLILNRIFFELTDILMWITIILADTHYYTLGIFVLGILASMAFFDWINEKMTASLRWTNPIDSVHRTLYLLPISFLQFFVSKLEWRIDFLYILFCLMIIAGLAAIISYCYQLFSVRS